MYTVDEAQKKLEYFCSYQERSHDEVVAKLRGMNMIPEAIDVIVVHLLDHNFLNEERFARSFARGKHRIKHWGRIRIVNELKFRGISKYIIDQAMKEIDPQDYLLHFHEFSERHWETLKADSPLKKRKKFCDFLLRKGFESQLVYEKVKELES